MKVEDENAAEEKRVQVRQLVKQAAEANTQARIQKQRRVEEAKKLDDEIVEYQKSRDRKEHEAQVEANRLKDEKEKEIQRLRELQEKAADRQAEIDALRAKRAFEEGERQARERERLENEKRLRIMADLEASRQKQFNDKQMSLAEQARIEREEYMYNIQRQKQYEAQEKKIEDEKKSALVQHSKKIRDQISINEHNTKQARLDYLEEGKKVREEIQDERNKIKNIQNAKIDELERLGIENKYMYEIQKKTVSF